ncbi:Uncharacterized protein APZ42_033496 [Daphnia magna]|uniref:Uncharacterized protein n=1 Tax=Daphnia magna TaxID=35525 RepID=A0A164L167_9CRUS|nr:Uncharacterized protein APZ42_033496 [Daphnia magna]
MPSKVLPGIALSRNYSPTLFTSEMMNACNSINCYEIRSLLRWMVNIDFVR